MSASQRLAPSLDILEREWQDTVFAAARALGWTVNHVRTTRGKGGRHTTSTSVVGWPDAEMVHPKHGIIYVELKSQSGRLSEAQVRVLDMIEQAGGRVFVWRPSDWPAVVDVLKGPAPAFTTQEDG